MLQLIWYNFIKIYVKIGLFFTLKSIRVYGKENIPEKGAILFVGNHQNALIDALLIPTTTKRNTHFLARAGAFQNKLANKILRTLNMLPAYRIRDGIRNMEKNHEVFERCIEILKNKKAIEIFAEGEHHLDRRIIPLKKGFARIILATLQKYPDLPIQIVPVGLNYNSRLNYPSSATVYYGKPIEANRYFDIENPDITFSKIKHDVTEAMKSLTLHIDDVENYDEIIQKLEAAGVDYLNPFEANRLLAEIDSKTVKPPTKKKSINWFLPFHLLAKFNSILPLLVWRKLKRGINDILFTNTFRFAVIATLFPLCYLIQAGIVHYVFNLKTALIYLGCSIVLGIITTKTMPLNR